MMTTESGKILDISVDLISNYEWSYLQDIDSQMSDPKTCPPKWQESSPVKFLYEL